MSYRDCAPRRRLGAALVAALILAPITPSAQDGSGDDGGLAAETVLNYAERARDALDQPPEGIRLLEPLADRLAELANQERHEHGQELAPLEPDPGLAEVAQVHAIDMLERDYVGHVGPRGLDAQARVGIVYRTFIGGAGENIGEQSGLAVDQLDAQTGPLASKTMNGFMGSQGHRENLLDPEYTHHGLAAAGRGERLLVVHVFGARRALLEQPLPLEVQQGSELPLDFEAGTTPAQYGYGQAGRSEQTIVPLELSLPEVSVDPGVWRLQFFYPTKQANTFSISPGPILVVR